MRSMIRWDSRRGRSALCGGLHSMKTLTHTPPVTGNYSPWVKSYCSVFSSSRMLLSDLKKKTVQTWFRPVWLMYVHSHSHTYIPEYIHYKRYFSLIEVTTFPLVPIPSSFAWMSIAPPFHQPTSQLIRQVHCVWMPPVTPAALAKLWTRRQAGRSWINVLTSNGDEASQDPGACSLPAAVSIPLISLRWPALASFSAEEISGFFHLLEIKITWRDKR